MIRSLIDALRIRRSGLLHKIYYRSQFYQELGADRYLLRLLPTLHYVLFGARQNKSPNPFFDTEFYRDANHRELCTGRNPLAQFLDNGARRRRNPSPFFDTEYYLDTNPEVAGSGVNPLRHFFCHQKNEGTFPSPLAATVQQICRPLDADHVQGRTWLHEGLGPPTTRSSPLPSASNGIIRFEWDKGGWNNIRMQAEVMVCLANIFGRSLVLPEAGPWYLVPGEATHLYDFFDDHAFRAAVPVLPSQTRKKDEWVVPAHLGVTNSVRLRREAFHNNKNRTSWYFPRSARMFGCLAAVLGSSASHYALVHKSLRIRTDLLDIAANTLARHGLKPGSFMAAHVRRGDFQYQDMRHLSIKKVIEALRTHGADAAHSLLIVSDAYDEPLLESCKRQGWNTICWAESQNENPKLAGVLDMLCCCPAWRFVGTPLSTFSSGIMQWRGYVSRLPDAHVDALPRFTTELDQVPWWSMVDQHAWLTI